MGLITMTRAAMPMMIAAVLSVAPLSRAEEPAHHTPPESGFAWKDGAEVYAKVCAFCHEAQVGPVIRGRGLDPTYISFMVRHGNRAMPAFRAAEIDDESLAKVAEYVSKSPANQ